MFGSLYFGIIRKKAIAKPTARDTTKAKMSRMVRSVIPAPKGGQDDGGFVLARSAALYDFSPNILIAFLWQIFSRSTGLRSSDSSTAMVERI